MRHTTRAAVAVIAGGLVIAGTACSGGGSGDGSGGGEVTLSFSHVLPESHFNALLDKDWMDAVTEASNGEIQFEVTYGAALCAAPENNGCVSDGIADLGHTSPAYHPADSAITMVGAVGFGTKDNGAQAQALHELYTESEEYQQEFADQNQHLLYFAPIEIPIIVSNTDGLETIDDLDGQKIRSNGPYVLALQELGAAPVTIAIGEIYESLERDVINGAQISGSAVVADYQLDEVGSSIYDLGIVGPTPPSMIVMNAGVWDGLSEEHQAILTEVSETMAASFGTDYLAPVYVETCEELEGAGLELKILEETENTESWAASVQEQQLADWKSASGLSDPQAFYDRYLELLPEYETPETNRSALEYCGLE